MLFYIISYYITLIVILFCIIFILLHDYIVIISFIFYKNLQLKKMEWLRMTLNSILWTALIKKKFSEPSFASWSFFSLGLTD